MFAIRQCIKVLFSNTVSGEDTIVHYTKDFVYVKVNNLNLILTCNFTIEVCYSQLPPFIYSFMYITHTVVTRTL